jgi:SAM-dependent methyltransferase
MRDTDADWTAISASQPYYAVLTDPAFLAENLTDDVKEAFFRTGSADITAILHMIHQYVDAAFLPESAIDFGSGVGRLVLAMADTVKTVIGVDVSPTMLAEARRNASVRKPERDIWFSDTIPEIETDWVSSLLVLSAHTACRRHETPPHLAQPPEERRSRIDQFHRVP